MMTSGPAATLGAVLHVPFERPRVRKDVLEHPEYYSLRETMIGFLESQEHQGEKPPVTPAAPTREPSPPGREEGSAPPALPLSRTVVPTE